MNQDAAQLSLPEFLHDPNAAPSWIARLVRWLAAHRMFLVPFTIVYFVAIVTLHDVMQQPAYWAQGQRGHRNWNNLVTSVAAPILAGFCIWMLVRLRRHARPWMAAAYLTVTVGLAVLFFRTLFCMNIEAIHYPQYAILAVLLFALTGSFAQTILWATLGGLLDEGYQYFYLYAGRKWIYMDFNDVILNSVGAGLGLVMLYVAGVHAARWRRGGPARPRPLYASPAGIAIGAFAVGCIALYSAGLLRVLPAAETHPWTIVLRRCGPAKAFWNPMNWGKTFHEVQPWEWVVVSIVLISFYALLDRLRPAKNTS